MHYIAERKRMDVVLGLLYGVGLLIIGTAATVYWSNGSKTVVLWFFISGAIWVELVAGFQAQRAIWEEQTSGLAPREQFVERRANIKLVSFYTVPIQDKIGEPLKGWAIQAIFKNFGQSDAKQVRVAYGHQYFTGPIPSDVDMTVTFAANDPAVDVGQGVEFRSEIKKFAMNVFDDIQPRGAIFCSSEKFAIWIYFRKPNRTSPNFVRLSALSGTQIFSPALVFPMMAP
jgi:hypothetical protein